VRKTTIAFIPGRSILGVDSRVVLAGIAGLASEDGTDEFVLARACMHTMDSVDTVVAADRLSGVALLDVS